LNRTMQLGFLFLGGAALVAASPLGLAMAQANCETLPTGPRRTDCYIGLNYINRQKSEISAGVAQRQAETAHVRRFFVIACYRHRFGTGVRRALASSSPSKF
jgi:hypothetical protein